VTEKCKKSAIRCTEYNQVS